MTDPGTADRTCAASGLLGGGACTCSQPQAPALTPCNAASSPGLTVSCAREPPGLPGCASRTHAQAAAPPPLAHRPARPSRRLSPQVRGPHDPGACGADPGEGAARRHPAHHGRPDRPQPGKGAVRGGRGGDARPGRGGAGRGDQEAGRRRYDGLPHLERKPAAACTVPFRSAASWRSTMWS